MHLPSILQERFATALAGLTDNAEKYSSMIRGTTDPKFGDYQANCAMPLSKELEGKNSREVAAEIVAALKLEDLCEQPEIAGPGFINLKLANSFIEQAIVTMLSDERCLVSKASSAKNIVIDFSSPNVAKPMHVGHIRSTVIGDSLTRILRFLGHNVITDNHLGDWGKQFGMIIYGYKHFGDPEVVKANPVPELAALYRKVNQIIDYPEAVSAISGANAKVDAMTKALEDAKNQDAGKKAIDTAERRLKSSIEARDAVQAKIDAIEKAPEMTEAVQEHPNIAQDVLRETVQLHAGDKQNMALWTEFLPHCKDEINRIYNRLDIEFDHTLGESFYHPMLAEVVNDLMDKGLATESDGAICVFLDDYDAPMIIQKKDGAFLYATTDLATIQYRIDEFKPDEILYVVDSRQGEHFKKLFQVADVIGMNSAKLVHVNFGTVLGKDGKPLKTRSGDLIGLEGLLDDAVAKSRQVVCDPNRPGLQMTEQEQDSIAEVVGIGAIKYADLSHYRTSDYRFDLAKMVALEGNTATYIQYSYARTRGILSRIGVTEEGVLEKVQSHGLTFTDPYERTLALMLLKLEESLHAVRDDYAPNHLVEHLYSTAKAFSGFNENCHVKNAATAEIQTTRLALVVASSRILKLGLSLLGIQCVDRM